MLYKCLISTNVEIPNNFSKCDLNVFDFHLNVASVDLGVDHVIISDFFLHILSYPITHANLILSNLIISSRSRHRDFAKFARKFSLFAFSLLGRIYVIDLPMRNPSLDVTTQCCQMPRGINFLEHFMKIPANLLVYFVKISIKDFIFSKICNANILFILLPYYTRFILLYTRYYINA